MAHSETVRPDLMAPELQVRETVERQQSVVSKYGSHENYKIAMLEREHEKGFWSLQARVAMGHKEKPVVLSDDERVVRDACGLSGVLCEEDVVNLMPEGREWKLPAFLNPVALAELPLGAIGLPQLTEEEGGATAYTSNIRYTRLPRADENGAILGCQVFDYRSYGWPTNQGTSARHVTVEEHREILKRLKTSGLAKAGSPEPVIGHWLNEILAADEPTPPWLCDGILREGGAALVYGGPGIGKSWFTYTLALGLATGKALVLKDAAGNPVLTFGEHNGVKVGIADGEMIRADFGQRMKELIIGLGLKPKEARRIELPPIEPEEFALALQEQQQLHAGEPSDSEGNKAALDYIEKTYRNHTEPKGIGFGFPKDGIEFDDRNIRFDTKTYQDAKAMFVSIADRQDRVPIIEWAKRNKIKVLILDNLSTLSSGMENENDATAIEPVNELIVSCKREGIAVILVHHTNKNGESYRGSSNILTVFETSIRLAPSFGPKDGARFSVLVEKDRNRGKLGLHKKTMALKNGTWTIEEDVNGQLHDIIAAARSLDFTTQKDLADFIGIDPSNISRGIEKAEALGLVKPGEIKGWIKKAREMRENPSAELDL